MLLFQQGSFGRRNRRYKIEPDVQSLETKRHVDNNLEFDDHDHIVRKLNEAAGNTNKGKLTLVNITILTCQRQHNGRSPDVKKYIIRNFY